MALIEAVLSALYLVAIVPWLGFIVGFAACLMLLFLVALWAERKQQRKDVEWWNAETIRQRYLLDRDQQ